eukprot:1681044-Pyramimonas_sp.AAC.1
MHLRHQGFLQKKFPEDTLCPLTTSEVDPSFGTHLRLDLLRALRQFRAHPGSHRAVAVWIPGGGASLRRPPTRDVRRG